MKIMKFVSIAAILAVAGCSSTKPDAVATDFELPESFTSSSSVEPAQVQDKWWQAFDSDKLNSLVDEAMADNLTIEQAWARLRQARAAEMMTSAADKVKVDLTAGAGTTRTRSETAAGDVENTTDSYSLGLAASYELDLWDRIKSQKQAAKLTVDSSREAVDTAATTIAASVVETWLDLLTQRQKRAILNQQLKTNQEYLELIELRYNASMVTALDIFRQRQAVEKVKSSLFLVDSAEQVLLNKLAALLGKMPGTEFDISADMLPAMPAMPLTGVPSQLLERRPDIKAAMLGVQISQWNLAEAKADKLPTFKLTASYRYSDDELSSLFDNWISNLAANLAVPLLDGKRLDSEVDRVKAVIEEKTALYKQTVITAISEVANALVQESYLQKNIEGTELQLDLAHKALQQAEDQYFNGVDNYLSTLTELLKVQALELELLNSRENLLLYRVALYRALGGRWVDEQSSDEL